MVSPDGLFEPVTAPFGPKQVPAAFQQRITEVLLPGLEGNGIESYIDDLCLHANNPAKFKATLVELLTRVQKLGLRLNGAKCTIGDDQADFLGMTVNKTGIKHQDRRKQAMIDLKQPTTKKQVKSFLGMAGYFRNHIEFFSRRSKLLTEMTKSHVNDQNFGDLWTPEHSRAFEKIKESMVKTELMPFINYDLPLIVRTDASVDGYGAILLQEGTFQWHICPKLSLMVRGGGLQ